MAMTVWREAWTALAGLLRLARGDHGGLLWFDRSLAGFWRSFRAAILCYPFYLVLLTMRVATADWQRSGGVRILAVESIGYVISWTAFPLAMLSLTRRIGRANRFFDFMVPYNWYQLPQSALFVLVGAAAAASGGSARSSAIQALTIAAAAAVLGFEWYLARIALDTTRSVATLVILVDLLLGALIDWSSGSLYR
jgi:hypothetical protein